MTIVLELQHDFKVKVPKESSVFKLEHKTEEPDWADIFVDGKPVGTDEYSILGNKLTFKDNIKKGTNVRVRLFVKVGKRRKK